MKSRPFCCTTGSCLLLLLIHCMLAGCGTTGSVKRMDENLDSFGPTLEDIAAMRQSLDEMTTELEGVHLEVSHLAEVINGLGNLERTLGVTNDQLGLTNQELDDLHLLRLDIIEMQERLGLLNHLNEGIDRINGELGNVNGQLDQLRSGLEAANLHIERLISIDDHLIGVDEGVGKLVELITLAGVIVPFLALLILGGIYNQWLTRRYLAKLTKMQDSGGAARIGAHHRDPD